MHKCRYTPIQINHPRTRKDIVKVAPTFGTVVVYNMSLQPVGEIEGRFKVVAMPTIVNGCDVHQLVRNYNPVTEFVLVDEVERV